MTPLPALAAMTAGGVLVARRRGVLHVATPGAGGLTPTGRLRRGRSPVCGQHGRSWTRAAVDGRPLCRRCARRLTVGGVAPVAHLDRQQIVDALAETLRTARDLPTVQAATLAVIAAPSGVMGALVDGDHGYPVRMTQLIRTSRERFERPVVGAGDHGWISSVKSAPPRRHPRRVS